MSMTVSLKDIQKAIRKMDPVRDIVGVIEEGFVAYSRGEVVVPPVGEMIFDDPRGDTHIKYGFIKHDDVFVIKIASGFYENYKKGLPTSHGLILVFSQKTGELICSLQDEGYLTQIRTAAAGAVVGRYFAPEQVQRVGVFGAGSQGRLQVEYLKYVRNFLDVVVWGLDQEELDRYREDMEVKGFRVQTTFDPEEIASTCNLIITATPSQKPLLLAQQIRKGTHITAIGSDTADKQELDSLILQKADRVIVDSLCQGWLRGEIHQGIKSGVIGRDKPVELGAAILDHKLHRQADDEITVADLTGVAVQDIQISKAVWKFISAR